VYGVDLSVVVHRHSAENGCVNRSTAGWMYVGVTVALWASAFPAIRVALESFGPAALSLLRAGVAAVALLIGTRLAGARMPARADLRQVALCGAAGIAAYQLLLNWGERTVTAGTASLLIATAPIYSLLIAGRMLSERMPRRRWIGLAVAMSGSCLVSLSSADGIALSVGALIVLAAAVVQGTYHVAQRPLLRTRTAYEVATYSMVAGTVMLLPATPSAVSQLGHASTSSIVAVVFLGLGPSAIGFVAWAAAVGRLEVSRPALALHTVPAIAILVAWWWLDELPTALAVVGGVISIVGVAFGTGVVLSGTRRVRAPAWRDLPG
jgi:drug/metabolite transporter (DMT)-like permease